MRRQLLWYRDIDSQYRTQNTSLPRRGLFCQRVDPPGDTIEQEAHYAMHLLPVSFLRPHSALCLSLPALSPYLPRKIILSADLSVPLKWITRRRWTHKRAAVDEKSRAQGCYVNRVSGRETRPRGRSLSSSVALDIDFSSRPRYMLTCVRTTLRATRDATGGGNWIVCALFSAGRFSARSSLDERSKLPGSSTRISLSLCPFLSSATSRKYRPSSSHMTNVCYNTVYSSEDRRTSRASCRSHYPFINQANKELIFQGGLHTVNATRDALVHSRSAFNMPGH